MRLIGEILTVDQTIRTLKYLNKHEQNIKDSIKNLDTHSLDCHPPGALMSPSKLLPGESVSSKTTLWTWSAENWKWFITNLENIN